jgi:hypothetical protein
MSFWDNIKLTGKALVEPYIGLVSGFLQSGVTGLGTSSVFKGNPQLAAQAGIAAEQGLQKSLKNANVPTTGSTLIGQWMFDGGSNFFGFTNTSQPTQNPSIFNLDMNRYVNFTGWTSGSFPSIIQQSVPQSTGGLDSFGNPIIAYNFLTTQISQNYVGGNAWYTWIIPTSLTNGQRQTIIDLNINNNPNLLTGVGTESTINTYTFTYTGSTIQPNTYRVYTTFPNAIFEINDLQNIYFRGNTIAP